MTLNSVNAFLSQLNIMLCINKFIALKVVQSPNSSFIHCKCFSSNLSGFQLCVSPSCTQVVTFTTGSHIHLKAVVSFHVHLLVVLFTSINLYSKQQQFVSYRQHPKDFKFLLYSLLQKFANLVTLFNIFFRLLPLPILQKVLEIRNIKKNISKLEKYIQINSRVTPLHTFPSPHILHLSPTIFFLPPSRLKLTTSGLPVQCLIHSATVSFL